MGEYNGFNIVKHGRFSTLVIKSVGKGALPKMLMGSFSDERRAKIAIDTYLSGKTKKGTSDDKANSST